MLSDWTRRLFRKPPNTLTIGETDIDLERKEIRSDRLTPKYVINPHIGRFELFGHVRGARGEVLYRIRSLNDGTILHMSKDIFNLFFVKESRNDSDL